ncbi:hypothetical protein, partial [Phormidium sp. CCY1219]|uniref:hypothetical protein n=1 Tax=Phormidium sp. CCY1219 TaxID=2886104 RepID=UPI002D1E53D1
MLTRLGLFGCLPLPERELLYFTTTTRSVEKTFAIAGIVFSPTAPYRWKKTVPLTGIVIYPQSNPVLQGWKKTVPL